MNQLDDVVQRLDKDLTDFCRLYGILCFINSKTYDRFNCQSIGFILNVPSIHQGELDESYTYNKTVDTTIGDPEYVDYVYKDFYRAITEYILDNRYTYVASVYRRHKIQISKPEVLSIPMSIPTPSLSYTAAQYRYKLRLGNNYSKSILTLEEMDIESLEFLKLVSKATGESLC